MSRLLEGENMNEPDAQTAPNYVTCPCQHCGGKIEFDANQLDPTEIPSVPCPHCELQTTIFVPEKTVPPLLASESLTKQKNQESRRKWDTFEEMRIAAHEGDEQAQCYLGVCYQNGMGVEQNFQEAAMWFRRAAEKNDPVGQCYLGVCYWTGRGVPQEFGEAAKWLRKAAELADPAAQFNLGMLYRTGEGVLQNYAEAVKWYRESAERGYPAAQFCLGVFYETGQIVPQDTGQTVPQDFTEAVKWYLAAAEQGLADAQCNLGLCYQTGRGVEQDSAAAVKWFIKAAEQGNATAQFNLGLAYDLGEGVPQNYVEAYKWANLANAAGLDGAKELRDALAQQMTPSQIEDGQRLASREASKMQNPTNHSFQERQERAAIPSEVRREVWRRDEGKCMKCGSRVNLEYDHIVPVSKGGSNTARNIELLCQDCNRTKSASIQ